MAGLKIGEFSAAAGVGRDTVRYYERMGLLPAAVRNGAGYRVYCDQDLERLQFIRHVHEAGFSLEQIRDLLEASPVNQDRVLRLLEVTRAKLAAAKANVDWLSQVEKFLTSLSVAVPPDGPQPKWAGFLAGSDSARRGGSHPARGHG
ncbi:MAG: MerR family transcriptional regulator [Sphingomonadaceae bacterium]|nr:MerR family transcriptional regulator [Sphingomonadaceae bacterium]